MKEIAFALLLLPSWLCAQPGRFVIESDIKGLPEGIRVELYQQFGNVGKRVAIDTIKDGRFRFEGIGNAAAPALYDVSLGGDEFPPLTGVRVWVWNNTTRITGDSILIKTWVAHNDLPVQKELNEYAIASRPFLVQWNLNQLKIYRMQADGRQKPQIDSLRKANKTLQNSSGWSDLEVMAQHPVSPVMIEKLQNVAQFYLDENPPMRPKITEQYDRLAEEQKNTPAGEAIKTALFPPVALKAGDEMVDGELYDQQGGKHTLAQFKGKYILLDFWSTGCGPCIMAGPELKEITEKHSVTITVVGISLDTDEAWKSFWEKIAWPNLSDGKGSQAGIAARYNVSSMPHYVLISPEGTIVDIWQGYGKGSITNRLKQHKVIE